MSDFLIEAYIFIRAHFLTADEGIYFLKKLTAISALCCIADCLKVGAVT